MSPRKRGGSRRSRRSEDETEIRPPDDGTEEYELDDELADDEELDPEAYERVDDDQLDSGEIEVVGAETEEWSSDEAGGVEDAGEERDGDESDGEEEGGDDEEAPAEESTELVGAGAVAAAGPTDQGRPGWFARVRWALGRPFRALRRMRLPLWARFLTASFLIVTSIAAATATSVLLYVSDIATALRHGNALEGVSEVLVPPPSGGAQTILLVGSDLRPEFKRVSDFRGLSDTAMLIRLDPDRDAIALFSLPRDLKVEIPGVGTDKLNAAYAYGGPKLTTKTITNLTGLEINHLVNIDFEGFARAVNAIDCVYVDVDRRYFHSNDNTVEDYEEVDLKPGYQALCGFDALDFARYRHTDNDVVRAARQQEFLREARQKVPPETVWTDRKELIPIFTEHTTSDIDDPEKMIEVLKLFLAARDSPVKEIHFEGTLGPSYVTATQAEIDRAVNQFLGIEDTPGARAKSAKPDKPGRIENEPGQEDKPAEAGKKKRKLPSLKDAQLVPTSFGQVLARGLRERRVPPKLKIYYPTLLESGSDFAEKPRLYKINGFGRGSPPDGQRPAYKWVFSRPGLGEYYGFMGTMWKDPPILESPHEEREIGGRTYKLYYAGDRVRLVGWQDDSGSYWLSNTLIQSISAREMIEIARGMRELPSG